MAGFITAIYTQPDKVWTEIRIKTPDIQAGGIIFSEKMTYMLGMKEASFRCASDEITVGIRPPSIGAFMPQHLIICSNLFQ